MIALVDKRRLDPWLAAADMCLPALCGMELGYAGEGWGGETGLLLLLLRFDALRQLPSHASTQRLPRDTESGHRCAREDRAGWEASVTASGQCTPSNLCPPPWPLRAAGGLQERHPRARGVSYYRPTRLTHSHPLPPGHYVLLVGYDGSTHEYVVRDPASGRPHLRVGAAALDAARRAFGTDEDLLVVQLPPGGAGGAGRGVGSAGGVGAGGTEEDFPMAQVPPGGEGGGAAGRRSGVLVAGGGGREEDLLVVQLPASGKGGGRCSSGQGGQGHRRHGSGRGTVQGGGLGAAVGMEVEERSVHVHHDEGELQAGGGLLGFGAAGKGGESGHGVGELLLQMEVEVQIEHARGHGGPGIPLWGCGREGLGPREEGAGTVACLQVAACDGGGGAGQLKQQQQCSAGDRLELTGHGTSGGGHVDLGGVMAMQGGAEGRVGPCGGAGVVGEGGSAAGWGFERVLGAAGGGLKLLTG